MSTFAIQELGASNVLQNTTWNAKYFPHSLAVSTNNGWKETYFRQSVGFELFFFFLPRNLTEILDVFIKLVITFRSLWCWNLGYLHFLLTRSSQPKSGALLWSWVQDCNSKEIPLFLWLLGVVCVPRAQHPYKISQVRTGRTVWGSFGLIIML